MFRKFLKVFLVTILVTIPSGVYAQQPPKIDGLVDIFNNVMAMVLPIGGLVTLVMMIYGGYMWIFSEGDPGKLKQAQGVITWALIGLLFLGVFGAILIAYFDFLG